MSMDFRNAIRSSIDKLRNMQRELRDLTVPGIYSEPEKDRKSGFLFLIALALELLQRMSLYEHFKRNRFQSNTVPAWYLERYLLLYWTISTAILTLSALVAPASRATAWWVTTFVCWPTIVQIVQTNLYHEFFRPFYLICDGRSPDVAHSRLRSLVIGLLNYCYVTILFGFVYFSQQDEFPSNSFNGSFDAIYFSFTFAWSAGSLSVPPNVLSLSIKLTIIVQIIVTLIMVAIFLSTAVGAIEFVREKKRHRAEGENAPDSENSEPDQSVAVLSVEPIGNQPDEQLPGSQP